MRGEDEDPPHRPTSLPSGRLKRIATIRQSEPASCQSKWTVASAALDLRSEPRRAYTQCVSRDDIIARIRAREEHIRALGASALYLFGSGARDELGDHSNIDVFIDRTPEFDYRFTHLIGLEALLKGVLDRPVDVMTRSSLHPLLRPAIEASAVRVL